MFLSICSSISTSLAEDAQESLVVICLDCGNQRTTQELRDSLFVINSPGISDFLHVILLLGCRVKQLCEKQKKEKVNHPPVEDHLSSGF